MKAFLLAGGKGTRLGEITKNEIPKPMAVICGKPIIEHAIERLKENNITDLTISVGYLKDKIQDYLQDGSKFGVTINYIEEDEPLGSAGALYFLKGKVDDDFVICPADAIFDIDFEKMMNFHKQKQAQITLFVHPNLHPYDSDLVFTDKDNRVTEINKKNSERNFYYKNNVNAGVLIVSPTTLSYFDSVRKVNMEHDFVSHFIPNGTVFAYKSSEYIKDVGTPERFSLSTIDIQNGLVAKKNLKNKQKAIFLDRDGTLNVYKNFIRKTEDIELLDNVIEAIKKINQSEYLAIVVSNQPVIARGESTFEEVDNMFNKIETLLGKEGAYIDGVYYCPHHPHSGYEGEVKELKIKCDCRKPNIGLLKQAERDFNLDLSKCIIIGDSNLDIQTGINANIKTIRVNTGIDEETKTPSDFNAKDLLEAVEYILNLENTMKQRTLQHINDFFERHPDLKEIMPSIIESILLIKGMKKHNKLLICGNGGSAADSEHIAGEFLKSFSLKRPISENLENTLKESFGEEGELCSSVLQQGVKAIPLTSFCAYNTAFLNDCNEKFLFAQLVNVLGEEEDILLSISTSGNSKNVVYATQVAKAKGMKVIALTGETGGRLKEYADILINAPSKVVYLIQEYHLAIYHLICLCVESELFDY